MDHPECEFLLPCCSVAPTRSAIGLRVIDSFGGGSKSTRTCTCHEMDSAYLLELGAPRSFSFRQG